QRGFFLRQLLERNKCLATTALLGGCLFPMIQQEMFQKGKQEGAESALLVMEMLQKVFAHKPEEELLGEVLSLDGIIPLTTNEGIKRPPVNAAELLKRQGRLRRIAVLGRQDDAPVSSGEMSRTGVEEG